MTDAEHPFIAAVPIVPMPILAASVAVFRNGKVLVAKRTRPPARGAYSLPGGRVEVGERLEDAALRELQEEVGVTAAIIAFNQHVEIIERAELGDVVAHFVVASFVARWIAGEAQAGDEAEDPIWVLPEMVGNLHATPHLNGIIATAAEIWQRNAVLGS